MTKENAKEIVEVSRRICTYISDIVAAAGLVFTCLPWVVNLSNQIWKRMKPAKFATAAKRWILIYLGLAVLLHLL